MERVSAKVDRKGVHASEVKGRFDPVIGGARDTLADPLGTTQLDVGGSRATDPTAVAGRGLSTASSKLPHLDAIQSAFGSHDVSGIKTQVGGPAKAAADGLGANAFASRGKVGFADAPSLHTAAHEAAHVVQQQQGVQLQGGVGRQGDRYEQHADAVADRVVSGQSAQDLLDAHPGTGGGQGVQKEIKRSSVEKANLALEGPAFGVPGLKWAVKAEGEKEVESEVLGGKPETTVKASLAGGLKYDLWFLELGVDLTADIEVKVEGNETAGAALHRGVKEFARWYAASRLGSVAEQRTNLQQAFQSCRLDVLAAYRELSELLRTSGFKDFKTGATSWFYFTMSPRQNLSMAIDMFHQEIAELFSVAKASGSSINAAKQFVDKQALLNEFAAAADTDEKNASRSIDRSRGKFLQKFDPAKDHLLSAFDGLDAAKMLERDPAVQFSGTFGAALSGKYAWGGGEEGGGEVEAQVGVAKRIQSGDEQHFKLGTQDVLKGKLGMKMGEWGLEFKAERQKEGEDQGEQKVKWKLELEGKKEGKLPEDAAERALGRIEKALGIVQKNKALADTCEIPTVLDVLKEASMSPIDKTEVKGEGGHEVSLGGELELEYARPNPSARWTREKVAGKAAAGGFGGAKGEIGLGEHAKGVGKIEGGVQKGYKLSSSWSS